MTVWAATIPLAQASAAAHLRAYADIRVAAAEPNLWLCGDRLTTSLTQELNSLPTAKRYRLTAAGCLTPFGRRAPTRTLPDLQWQPIQDFFQPSFPAGRYPAAPARRLPWTMVRSAAVMPADLLLADLDMMTSYIETVPAHRLKVWRVAAANDGRVAVVGTPLPAVRGRHFYGAATGFARPAGWTCEPDLAPAVIYKQMQLHRGDILLCHVDGSHEIIAGANFVPMTRSAMRLTKGRVEAEHDERV